MKLIVQILSLLLFENITMAQNIEFNQKGLDVFQIGDSINISSSKLLLPISQYQSDNKRLRLGNIEDYTYYFVDMKTIKHSIGLIEEIFIILDTKKRISNIHLFLKSNSEASIEVLNKTFGNHLLESISGHGSLNTGSKKFWANKEISIFYIDSIYSKYSEISISKILDESNYSSVSLY